MNDQAAELEARVAERVKNMSDAEVEASIENKRAKEAKASAKIWMAGWYPPEGYYDDDPEYADPGDHPGSSLKLHTRDCRYVHANQAKPYVRPRLATDEELKTQSKCKVCG
jgi:hypothetical protein